METYRCHLWGKEKCHALPHRFDIQPKACHSVLPYRRPINLPHLPEARRHLPHAVRLQSSHDQYYDYNKAQRCWTNDAKSDPTRHTGCMPASTSRRRQLWKNGTTSKALYALPKRHRYKRFQPGCHPPISMHNSDGNLASQMQS